MRRSHARILFKALRLQNSENTAEMVMCDLDRLKKINDKYGHSEGDNAIKKVADAIRK